MLTSPLIERSSVRDALSLDALSVSQVWALQGSLARNDFVWDREEK